MSFVAQSAIDPTPQGDRVLLSGDCMKPLNDTVEGATLERDWRVTRLGDELDKLLKLITWARECLDNELMSGLGYKRLAISDKDIKKISMLAATMNSAVEAKIRFDKAQKQLAESMTPEEEFQAVVAFIKTLEYEDKNRLMTIVRHPAYHNGHKGAADGSPDTKEG